MKRKTMVIKLATAGILSIGLGATGAWAAGGDSRIENLGETFYSNPNQYQFDDRSDSEELTFDEERRLRICMGEGEDLIPLELEYNNSTKTVDPGQCQEINVKEVTVRPAEEVPPNTFIVWTYEEASDEAVGAPDANQSAGEGSGSQQ